MAVEKQEGRGITEFIVSELRRIRGESLPEDVVRVARHCLLDWMGVTVAGAGEPLVQRLLEDARDDGGRLACTVVWHGERVFVLQGALINASGSDALDFSDSNPAMRGQSTPAVIGAAPAMCISPASIHARAKRRRFSPCRSAMTMYRAAEVAPLHAQQSRPYNRASSVE